MTTLFFADLTTKVVLHGVQSYLWSSSTRPTAQDSRRARYCCQLCPSILFSLVAPAATELSGSGANSEGSSNSYEASTKSQLFSAFVATSSVDIAVDLWDTLYQEDEQIRTLVVVDLDLILKLQESASSSYTALKVMSVINEL